MSPTQQHVHPTLFTHSNHNLQLKPEIKDQLQEAKMSGQDLQVHELNALSFTIYITEQML
jgi:hypothetical protein